MPTQPLTHHEILRWVEPFTRRGRHVDLAASDRIARRLVFKPIEHEAVAIEGAAPTSASETLQLDDIGAGGFRLTRVSTLADGLAASLLVDGSRPGELLARIEAVPIERQFRAGPGFVIAQSHRLRDDDASALQLLLTRGIARVGALTLTLVPPTVRGVNADLTLAAPAGETLALPDDLLAVLGPNWARLDEAAGGWRGSLRLRGGDVARSRAAEARLQEAAAHLARCLAEAPARFHDRHRAARWRVYARRSVPLLTCIALIAAAASVPRLGLHDNSPWRMLIFNAPPLLLILVFCLRELPRIEIPPWPRRSTAPAWRIEEGAGERCPATR